MPVPRASRFVFCFICSGVVLFYAFFRRVFLKCGLHAALQERHLGSTRLLAWYPRPWSACCWLWYKLHRHCLLVSVVRMVRLALLMLFRIVKNSWGPGWGMKGFFEIAQANNECGICTTPSYPTGASLNVSFVVMSHAHVLMLRRLLTGTSTELLKGP